MSDLLPGDVSTSIAFLYHMCVKVGMPMALHGITADDPKSGVSSAGGRFTKLGFTVITKTCAALARRSNVYG